MIVFVSIKVIKMHLRVNLKETAADEKRSIDPRVKVRFGFLTREGERLSDQDVDRKLREKAQEDSPGASLSDLIKAMVKEVAYGQARLSLQEFIDRFKKNRLADVIASKFANSLFEVDNDVVLSPSGPQSARKADLHNEAEARVLQSVVEFLEKYNLTSAETLFEFLKQQKADWPMVEIGRLFLEEYEEIGHKGEVTRTNLREKVAGKVRDNIDRIAAEAYQEKFNEDRRGFIMGFLMGRVIKYDSRARKMSFDPKEFNSLMTYLDSIGQTVNRMGSETLYDWLYYDSRQMARYIEEQRVNSLKFGVREDIAKTGLLDESDVAKPEGALFFDEEFDVKSFHDRHIKPAIFKFYSQKLRKLVRVREPDFLHRLNDPENLGTQNHTVQLMRYIKALVETAKDDPKNFMSKVREVFGLNDTPMMQSLSNKEVQEHFAYCFAKAEEKFRKTLSDALAYRGDVEVKEACVYPEEILDCRDLAKLLEWFYSPKTFKETYRNYRDIPDDQIAYACSAFLRDFLRVSKKLSNKQFREAEQRRDFLEKYMKKTLDIRTVSQIQVRFKLLEELDAQGKPLAKRQYEVAYDDRGLGQFANGMDRQMTKAVMSSDEPIIEYNGKKYLLYPAETKDFKKVKMQIPDMPMVEESPPKGRAKDAVKKRRRLFNKRRLRDVEALIYTGDSHYIHVKDDIARLSSEDRGKEVSDENRWMLVFSSDEDAIAFRNYIYSAHARNLIKADDPAERRSLSIKGRKPVRTKNSTLFKEAQSFSISKVFSFPQRVEVIERDDQGNKVEKKRLQMVDTLLETQCQNLRALLIYNLTDYSVTSHNSYRSERAWPLLFSLYFPPEYFGDKYKNLQVQGFKYEG